MCWHIQFPESVRLNYHCTKTDLCLSGGVPLEILKKFGRKHDFILFSPDGKDIILIWFAEEISLKKVPNLLQEGFS